MVESRGRVVLGVLLHRRRDEQSRIAVYGIRYVGQREERQIVESVMDQYPDTWRTEWLRLKGLPQWAEYFQTLEEAIVADEVEEVAICARA